MCARKDQRLCFGTRLTMPLRWRRTGWRLALLSGQMAPALKPYERSNHAYDIARNILSANPRLRGNISGYRYVSQRVGKNFKSFVNRFRLEGDLSRGALAEFKHRKMERRFLLLATISPLDEIIELPAEVEPLTGSTPADRGL